MGSLGRTGSPSSAESGSTQQPCPLAQTPGSAEEAATPQTLQQYWEHTVFILNSPEFASMDCWLVVPSRNRTKRETFLPGFQAHLEGQPKLATR